MLTNLFSKSRPIGYIAIGLLLLVVYFLQLISDLSWLQSPTAVIEKIILFFAVVFSVLLIQFITVKNNLAVNNLYSLFFYACFLIIFPTYFDDSELIIANLLILLALRRIISLQSLKLPKIKIFDASLWIFFATIFESWAILYFLMIYLAIIWYVSEDYRHWILPLVALFTVTVLFYTYSIIIDIDFIDYWKNKYTVGFNFNYFDNVYQNIGISLFATIAVFFIANQFMQLKKIKPNQLNLYKNIVLCFIIGVVIYSIAPEKSNGLLVFTFFPLSIIGGNFIKNNESSWVKETVLSMTLILSLILFLLKL